VVDVAINAPDGEQSELDGALNGKSRVTQSEPVLTVRAAECMHPTTQPLQSQKDFTRNIERHAPAPDDQFS
jgi:hypothetical protein